MQEISRDVIEKIVKQVLMAQGISSGSSGQPQDTGGVIALKASQVKPEPFDTGKPGDKVWLKDIYSLEESPRLGAGIMEMDHSAFDWTLNYDEIDYIIEGSLEIIINGKSVFGNQGDVLLIPKGSSITFSSPGFCRFLYVVYPANWAEQ
jgi:ethanolamine utilization protein EutQ